MNSRVTIMRSIKKGEVTFLSVMITAFMLITLVLLFRLSVSISEVAERQDGLEERLESLEENVSGLTRWECVEEETITEEGLVRFNNRFEFANKVCECGVIDEEDFEALDIPEIRYTVHDGMYMKIRCFVDCLSNNENAYLDNIDSGNIILTWNTTYCTKERLVFDDITKNVKTRTDRTERWIR